MRQNTKQKISVLIPVYNEEGSIGKVLYDIPKKLVDEIVVIDNGSTDSSIDVARSYGVTVLQQPILGYGAACLTGINYLKQREPIPDLVIFIDGDYSDYPQEMNDLVKKINRGYDFVLGSRILGIHAYGAKLPIHSVLGNKLAAFFLKYLFNGNYTDLGPFRIIKFKKLLGLDMSDMNYGWTMEMQIKALRNHLKICEIPVHYRERYAGVSKVTGNLCGSMKAILKITFTIIVYFFKLR